MHVQTRAIRSGIDVGGTFTDFHFLDEESGEVYEFKAPTTPADPAEGMVEGILGAARRFGFDVSDIKTIVHGTTIATNAVLENKLPRGVLLTTAGFEDLIEIGRHLRRDVYGLYAEPRRLLLPRADRYGIRERILADGRVETALDEARVEELGRRLRDERIEVAAVCFLNSFVNPAHEKRVAEILASVHPELNISLSCEISPEFREYERLTTTVLNGLLMPVVRRYMANFRVRLVDNGISARRFIIQSNGGVTSPEKAGDQPAKLLLSGPCGGTVAVERLSTTLGEANLVAVDMGGTSFDVSVVENGAAAKVSLGEVDGCPVRLPMVEMRTIGAGGGSIASVNAGGRLSVGPESAGSNPGPACYGRGGKRPAVTDANLLLGRIDPNQFFGGALVLDVEAAAAAMRKEVCDPLGLSLEDAALGVVAIANTKMANAIRLSLFEKGLDPEDFTLVSFGGAGGLHALDIAADIGIGRVIFPRSSGTFSSYGMLWCDVSHDFARTSIQRVGPGVAERLRPVVAELMTEAAAQLAEDGIAPSLRHYQLSMDMRYAGQGYEIAVPLAGNDVNDETFEATVRSFHALHRQRFSMADEKLPVEIVTVRLSARGDEPKPAASRSADVDNGVRSPRRSVYGEGGWQDAAILSRGRLVADGGIAGPAIVEEEYTTIFVPAGWRLEVLPSGDVMGVMQESN